MPMKVDFPALKPADLEILLALSARDRHGYGLMKEVERQSDGQVVLELGSLYRLIARLERDGMIQSLDDRPTEPERRKYYRLTDFGRRALKAEARRLSRLVEVLRARKLAEGPEGLR